MTANILTDGTEGNKRSGKNGGTGRITEILSVIAAAGVFLRLMACAAVTGSRAAMNLQGTETGKFYIYGVLILFLAGFAMCMLHMAGNRAAGKEEPQAPPSSPSAK